MVLNSNAMSVFANALSKLVGFDNASTHKTWIEILKTIWRTFRNLFTVWFFFLYFHLVLLIYYLFPDESKVKFDWDCIVISAADEEQKKCFELQLQQKIFSQEIPNLKYLVVADPPKGVIGSGGSTFFILSVLKDIYGFQEELSSKRILLIHAGLCSSPYYLLFLLEILDFSGGFSKRLPNLSCTGKLFCPLPIETKEGKPVCVLYLKLVITYPFMRLMKNGGVFITCSDDITMFSLEGKLIFHTQQFFRLQNAFYCLFFIRNWWCTEFRCWWQWSHCFSSSIFDCYRSVDDLWCYSSILEYLE